MGAVVRMRELRSSDGRLLVRATLGNVNWSGERFTLADLEATPELSHYFTAWPPDREFGVVAENAHGLAPVGVAWARVFPADDPGYGFVDEATPEVSVWVSPHRRGQGIGSDLMMQMIEQAREREFSQISLSVENGNPARRLYERLGFVPAGRDTQPGTLILRL